MAFSSRDQSKQTRNAGRNAKEENKHPKRETGDS